MKSFPFAAASFLLLTTIHLQADPTAASPNDGFEIAPNAAGTEFLASWWGIENRFYFIEQSKDMAKWKFMPIFEVGSDDIVAWAFEPNAPRMFFRLLHTADTDSDLMARDFDRDGLTTYQEYLLGSEPFDPDTNGDGVFDGIAYKLGISIISSGPPAPDPSDHTPPVITLASPVSAVLVP